MTAKSRVYIPSEYRYAITSLSNQWEQTWSRLLNGECGFQAATDFFSDLNSDAPVASCDLSKKAPFEQRARQLVADVTSPFRETIRELKSRSLRLGVIIATAHGEAGAISTWCSYQQGKVSIPSNETLLSLLSERLHFQVSDSLGCKLPMQTVSAACASGLVATGMAFNKIQQNQADAYLIVAVDPLSKIAFTGFRQIGAMSSTGCTPFDAMRNGTTIGEGAASYLVCSERVWDTCDAPEILSFAHNCSALHPVEPSATHIAEVLRTALSGSGQRTEDISCAILHGTGTVQNDLAEAEAVRAVFGSLPCSTSIKGNLGHTMGAASALSILSACNSLETKLCPPCRYTKTEFPWLSLSSTASQIGKGAVIVTGLGFGGINSAMVLGMDCG